MASTIGGPLLAALAAMTIGASAAPTAPDGPELTRRLTEFLSGASRNDPAAHERFWADEVVYTGSSGRRVGKADILRDVRSAPAPKPGDPVTTYGAEDVRIQQYGDTAVVAFRLVGTTEQDGRRDVARYLNTGTFLKRGGRWRVVAWQATRLPPAEETARKDVEAAAAGLRSALLAGDAKALRARLDDGFAWTQPSGERLAAKQLLEGLESGRLRYSALERSDAELSLHGETAVARGPFATLTLVNRGGAWKAVALHTSR